MPCPYLAHLITIHRHNTRGHAGVITTHAYVVYAPRVAPQLPLEREVHQHLARYLYPRGTASSVDQALSVLAGLEV